MALWRYSGFTSLVPDFLSLARGATKPKLRNSQKITVLTKLNFLRCFTQCQTKNILGEKNGFMGNRGLMNATFLSHGQQREVSSFPI